jgi:hypothetical protein
MSNTIHAFKVEHAELWGIECAIVISHFIYWVEYNLRLKRNFKDNRTWTYQTQIEMAAHFPYWSEDQIYRILKKLTNLQIIIKGNFNKSAYDRTIWYAFKNEFMFINPTKINNTIPQNRGMDSEEERNEFHEIAEPIPNTKTDNEVCSVSAAEAAEEKYEEKIIFPGKGKAVISIKETVLRFNLYREGFTEREIKDAIDKIKNMKKRPALCSTIEKYVAGIILKTRKQDEIDKAIAFKKRKEKKASPFDLPENIGVAKPEARLTPEQIKDIFYPKEQK